MWKLPEPICIAVRQHHSAGDELSLGKVISAADSYIRAVGLSIHPPVGSTHETPDDSALRALGLAPKLVEALTGDFDIECKAMMQFLQ
jgi:hypothetical protein